MKNQMKNIQDKGKQKINKFRNYIIEVIKIKKSPHSIAIGFAIGTFLAIFPTPGLSIPIAILIAFIYPRMSKISALSAFVIWNPLLTLPLYGLSYKLGHLIYGNTVPFRFDIVILESVYENTKRFLIGNIILATSISTSCYFIIKKAVKSYQKEHKIESEKQIQKL